MTFESPLMEDFPASVLPDDPAWSENFCLAAFDPNAQVDLFLHLGRWRGDLSLWREVLMIALPDGTVLGQRAIGNSRVTPAGPGGPSMALTIERPGQQLRWQYLGAARRVAAEELRDGILADGPLQRMEIDIQFHSALPVWDISQVGHATEFMGRGHAEQIGRVSGFVKVGQQRFDIDTLGNRDHSRGIRDFSANRRHIWMHGTFDNGVSFLGYEAELFGQEGPAFSELGVYDGGRLYPAKLSLERRLEETSSFAYIHDPISFNIDYELGCLQIDAQCFPTTLHGQASAPNDLYIGVRHAPGIWHASYVEQSVQYRLNGIHAGYGHMERTVPGVWLKDAS